MQNLRKYKLFVYRNFWFVDGIIIYLPVVFFWLDDNYLYRVFIKGLMIILWVLLARGLDHFNFTRKSIILDAPELSSLRRRSSDLDPSTEKVLLVNPNCPVRIMLEYIRKRCRLGTFTQFDLCDESGYLKGLFSMPTYVYATDQFHHKNTYYVVVIKQETEKKVSVLPQLNRENQMYIELKTRVKKFLAGEASPMISPPSTTPGKGTPPVPKPTAKKK